MSMTQLREKNISRQVSGDDLLEIVLKSISQTRDDGRGRAGQKLVVERTRQDFDRQGLGGVGIKRLCDQIVNQAPKIRVRFPAGQPT